MEGKAVVVLRHEILQYYVMHATYDFVICGLTTKAAPFVVCVRIVGWLARSGCDLQ